MSKLRILIGIAGLASLFVFVSPAFAHRPDQGNEGGVTEIESPTTSYAYYRELEQGDELHIYRFEAEAGQFFHAGINIPQLDRLEDYGVQLALVGPGLPSLSGGQLEPLAQHEDRAHAGLSLVEALPAEAAGEDQGGLVLPSERGPDFYEPFTQTNYWGRQTLELDLPATGAYYLLVWNPQGQPGKYVLDTGVEEVFGPGDLFRFPAWWLQTRLYFEQLPQLAAAGAAILAALLALILVRRRRAQPALEARPRAAI